MNNCDTPDASEAGSSSRSSSRSDWSSNRKGIDLFGLHILISVIYIFIFNNKFLKSSNITSTSSSKSSDSISTPRGLPPEDIRPPSSLNKSRPPSRKENSEEQESKFEIPPIFRHRRDNSNISSTSGKSSIQSEIDRISQTGMIQKRSKCSSRKISRINIFLKQKRSRKPHLRANKRTQRPSSHPFYPNS